MCRSEFIRDLRRKPRLSSRSRVAAMYVGVWALFVSPTSGMDRISRMPSSRLKPLLQPRYIDVQPTGPGIRRYYCAALTSPSAGCACSGNQSALCRSEFIRDSRRKPRLPRRSRAAAMNLACGRFSCRRPQGMDQISRMQASRLKPLLPPRYIDVQGSRLLSAPGIRRYHCAALASLGACAASAASAFQPPPNATYSATCAVASAVRPSSARCRACSAPRWASSTSLRFTSPSS